MNTKKTIFIFLLIIFLILLGGLFLKNSNFFGKGFQNEKASFQENFFIENSFEEREHLFSRALHQSQNLNSGLENISTSIIVESDTHALGTYTVLSSEDKGYTGFFLGLISNNKLEIIWTGEKAPDCKTLLSFNISENIAPHCFK